MGYYKNKTTWPLSVFSEIQVFRSFRILKLGELPADFTVGFI